MSKKIFIFFPDGVGLRNFAFTEFKSIGEKKGFDIVYWNNTKFSLKDELGFEEIKIENEQLHPLTPLYSRARKRIELNMSEKKFKDDVYPKYKFPFKYKRPKNILKSLFVKSLIGLYNSEKGLKKVKQKINTLERKNPKYHYCKQQLKTHQPDLIFCTTQRFTQSIAPLLAAQDLGIPTVAFVYSWDNVPKAMQVVETDYYCVWSEHMKGEVLKYYSFVNEDQVFVTGTPQFEPHYDRSLLVSREDFCRKHLLNPDKKYICFSGDDETTSPLDQYYLKDLAKAVKNLNKKGHNLGIIYRKCPVDLTKRYDWVIDKYKEVITPLPPAWQPIGENWNEVMPTQEDIGLLVNICHHCELVTNVCSSTVFDFVAHGKPCLYYNYEQPQLNKGIRDIRQNYDYVHFRSMPKNAVIWCKDKTQLADKILEGLKNPKPYVEKTEKWFGIINKQAPELASDRIVSAFQKLTFK